jgi:hypothetical protein
MIGHQWPTSWVGVDVALSAHNGGQEDLILEFQKTNGLLKRKQSSFQCSLKNHQKDGLILQASWEIEAMCNVDITLCK